LKVEIVKIKSLVDQLFPNRAAKKTNNYLFTALHLKIFENNIDPNWRLGGFVNS
jgi:hypothetical protein